MSASQASLRGRCPHDDVFRDEVFIFAGHRIWPRARSRADEAVSMACNDAAKIEIHIGREGRVDIALGPHVPPRHADRHRHG